MTTIESLLNAYDLVEERRARGGIWALSGFDYQLRCYIARLVISLAQPEKSLEQAGQQFIEALSDLSVQTKNDGLICVQIKRSLTSKTLKDAADEIVTIEKFLQTHSSGLTSPVKYEVMAMLSEKNVQWTNLPKNYPHLATINALLASQRLTQPVIQTDPWWQALSAVWGILSEPYTFLRFALDRALRRDITANSAVQIRDDICEKFAGLKVKHNFAGQILMPRDFKTESRPSKTLDIGREITLARLRDQQYMPRPERLDGLYQRLLAHHQTCLSNPRSEVDVFWLNGRSGVGKSVLLLQTVERLVAEGWRVLWLKGDASALEPCLNTIANCSPNERPDFIAIDDIYDRDARSKLNLYQLSKFIDEQARQVWPMIVTCGPSEFAQAFKEETSYQGFKVHLDVVDTIASDEAQAIDHWYKQRTGKASQRGAAFSQALMDKNGLFISLAVELAHGDLRNFASRFADRVRVNELEQALRLPLTLNRLYLRAPYHWLSQHDRQHLASLNKEGDFTLMDDSDEGQIMRLTHPHLADSLYLAIRKPANSESYKDDLVEVFRLALTERNTGLVSQLLRTFSSNDDELASERLEIVKDTSLPQECFALWQTLSADLKLSADGEADAATSWACWAAKDSRLISLFNGHPADLALKQFSGADKFWSAGWLKLAARYPQQPSLFCWAKTHLSDPVRLTHPTWSLVWDKCLEREPRNAALHALGLTWLQSSLRRPDWHFVWKKLLPPTPDGVWYQHPLIALGIRRLYNEQEGPDWAYVFQDIYKIAHHHQDQQKVHELESLAVTWLETHKERSEWAHVWRALLQNVVIPLKPERVASLLNDGAAWLTGHEERREWAFIWQELVDNRTRLPETIIFADILLTGNAWLAKREDRLEWTFVWRKLAENAEPNSSDLSLQELLEQGHRWLKGRQHRDDWVYVWRVLQKHESAVNNTQWAEVVNQSINWLDMHANHHNWVLIWENSLKTAHELALSQQYDYLQLAAFNWLPERKERADWKFVWQALSQRFDDLPPSVDWDNLLQSGFVWLKKYPDDDGWGFICERLLELKFISAEFFEMVALWLHKYRNVPSWPLMAAKFILIAPTHPASAHLVTQLENEINAWPNRGLWLKMSMLLNDAKKHTTLSENPEKLYNAVQSRKNAPAWQQAQIHLGCKKPIQGTVVSVKQKNRATVHLSIGLIAFWYLHNTKSSLYEGQNLAFYIHNIRRADGIVEVDIKAPSGLLLGSVHQGVVQREHKFGLTIHIGSISCMLHYYDCGEDWEIATSYRKGSMINVRIAALTEEGIRVLLADTRNAALIDQAPEVGNILMGTITGIQPYGLFFKMGVYRGLVHKSSLPPNINLQTKYHIRQSLNVQIAEIRPDGTFSLILPQEG